MEQERFQPAEAQGITLSGAVVHRLLGRGSGDAALLYLALCQARGATMPQLQSVLAWETSRIQSAMQVLLELHLLGAPGTEPLPLPGTEPPPDYTRDDISRVLEADRQFASLRMEAERRLGPLASPAMAKLLALYDTVGLPAEVICQLIVHCQQRAEGQNGSGRVTMQQIYREGCKWARLGILSSEKADAYLKEYARQKAMLPRYIEALGLPLDRKLSPTEEKYLVSWMKDGFPPDTVAIAYDRTILNCQRLKWRYLNGILKNWKEQGLFTPEQVNTEPYHPASAPSPQKDDNTWMRDYIQN